MDFASRPGGGASLMIALALCGCGQQPIPNCGPTCRDLEPNDSFGTALAIRLDANGSATLSGEIDVFDDIDVYAIGPVSAGDVVEVSLSRIGANLRAALALYDADGELINEDTMTSLLAPSADPAITHAARVDSGEMYVAVSHAVSRPTVGAYELAIRVRRSGDVPTPRKQIVLLNFSGGTVVDPIFDSITVGPFDAGAIHPNYAGATDAMKSVIRQTIERNYARFEIEFPHTDEPNVAIALSGREYARVVFGGFNSQAFGAAESVDLYNTQPIDSAIVFTESFEPGFFSLTPTAEELAVAIGNVASHEIGHLLGLHHVRDATAVMDEASPAVTLLATQDFKSARLSPSIFPLGLQDSADLLGVTLGWRADAAKITGGFDSPLADALRELLDAGGTLDFGPAPPAPAKCLNCLRHERMASHVTP